MVTTKNRALLPETKVGRPGITQLPMPHSRFDLARTPGFETEEAVTEEDRYRAGQLKKRAARLPPPQARALEGVANAIDPSVTRCPTTPASSRYMRRERIRVLGAVWAIVYESTTSSSNDVPFATFTVIPEGLSVPLGQLATFCPTLLKKAFRQHLIRSAARLGVTVEGQLFAALHGAYDPTTRSYPLHFHGCAAGVMVSIIAGLRDLRRYRPAQPHDGRDAAITPVRIARGPLSNMPEPLTYIMKRFWPLRETYLDADALRKARKGPVRRIRGEAEIEYLQFLHKWRIEDTTLIMGMHATKAGLIKADSS